MKVFTSCSFAILALTGCAPSDEDFPALRNAKNNVVVLSQGALAISPEPTKFAPIAGAEVVGRDSGVCVVLASGVPGEEGDQSDVLRLLGGAELRAVVVTSDGTDHDFNYQGSSWALRGKLCPTGELTACAHPSSLPLIAAGSKIHSVSISSTSPVHALGVYWSSTDAF